MSTIGENFRTHLLSSTSITAVVGQRIHQTHWPESSTTPAIWFQRASESEEVLLDGACGVINTHFDLECVSSDVDVSLDLGRMVKRYLHGDDGTLVGTTARVQGIFVIDKDDDYIPRLEGSDDGRTVTALDISIWST